MKVLSRQTAIDIVSLSKRYGSVHALQDLVLEVKEGEIMGMLGANGAGKSTTINLLLNIIQPDSGYAKVCGHDTVKEAMQVRKNVAYVPENLVLYPFLSALENMEYFVSLSGLHAEKTYLAACLCDAGLSEEHHARKVSTFSKGMRQKVGIALALARKCRVLLLDEPTSGLDPAASNEFAELLVTLSEKGTTVMMATHDLFRVRETAHRIAILNSGQLVEEFRPGEMTHRELEGIYLNHMK